VVWSFEQRALCFVTRIIVQQAGRVCAFAHGANGFLILRVFRRVHVATVIALVNFTDQGVRHIRQTTEREKALMNAGANLGVRIKEIYWTLGAFDAVFTADAPDEETMTAFTLSVGSLGNIRTQTLRAFSADEMNKILEKVPAGNFSGTK
jgi:uncharacterized protein with GYD domain